MIHLSPKKTFEISSGPDEEVYNRSTRVGEISK
jgi:hypothetical protein